MNRKAEVQENELGENGDVVEDRDIGRKWRLDHAPLRHESAP